MSICVVQTRPGIGDMCVFLPYIHLIAKEKKEKVTIIAKARSRSKDFLEHDPYVLKVIYIDEKNKDQYTEVKTIQWLTETQCYDKIRDYDTKKRVIIENTFKFLRSCDELVMFKKK